MLASAVQSGWVPYLFFESPGWLMVFLALFFAATRIAGRRTGNPRLLHLSWIAVGLIALLFASSYLVTTKREQLTVALKHLLQTVEDKDFEQVRTLVDDEAMVAFMGEELTREQMIARVDEVQFDDIILIGSSAALDSQQGFGITGLRVNAKGSVDDFPGINVSEWAIRWRYDDGQWVAIRLECVDMGADVLFNRED